MIGRTMRDAGAQPGYSFYIIVIIINLIKTANSDEERNAPGNECDFIAITQLFFDMK